MAWCMRLPQHQAKEVAKTTKQRYPFIRSVCSQELVQADCMIGGEGHVVQIDQTSLAKKQKYGRGRHYKKFWLFGGVDRTTGRWFGRIVYDKRTKATLIPAIKVFIKPKTHFISDTFATYVCERGGNQYTPENNRILSRMEYTHDWVNHSMNFVDPETGVHTIKVMRGMTNDHLESYIDEYMWRSWFFPPKVSSAQYLCGLMIAIRRSH